MILSKRTFWFKVFKTFVNWNKNPPQSLCSYIRHWICIIATLPFVLVLLPFIGIGVLVGGKEEIEEGLLSKNSLGVGFTFLVVSSLVLSGLRPIFYGFNNDLWVPGAIVFYIILLIMIIAYLYEQYEEYTWNKKYEREKKGIPPPKPSVFKLWLKAKKEKVCPRITWYD